MSCQQCFHKLQESDAFCSQCGSPVSSSEKGDHDGRPYLSLNWTVDVIVAQNNQEKLNMSVRLMESDILVVLTRMTEAKHAAKKLSQYFRDRANSEQKHCAEIKKSISVLLASMPQATLFNQLAIHLSSLVETEGQASITYVTSLNDEIAVRLNAIRLDLKDRIRNQSEKHSKASKAVASNSVALTKAKARIAKLERQINEDKNNPHSFLASRSAATVESAFHQLPAVHQDHDMAMMALDASKDVLIATKLAILQEEEVLEVRRMQLIKELLDRASASGEIMLRKKLISNVEFGCWLKKVSVIDDIERWVKNHELKMSNIKEIVPQPEIEIELVKAVPSKVVVDVGNCVWAADCPSLISWIPDKSFQSSCPMLDMSQIPLKTIALCVCYQLSLSPQDKALLRRDIRILLGIRESDFDSVLLLYQSLGDVQTFGQVLLDTSSRSFEFGIAIIIILGKTIPGPNCSQELLVRLQQLLTSLKSEPLVDLHALSFLADLCKDCPDYLGPNDFQPAFSLLLYRKLMTVIVDQSCQDDTDVPDKDNFTFIVFEDWRNLIDRLQVFKSGLSIPDTMHYAILLECLHQDVVCWIQKVLYGSDKPKIDIFEHIHPAAFAALDFACKSCRHIGSEQQADDTAWEIKSKFKEWLCAILSEKFDLSPVSAVKAKQLMSSLIGDDTPLYKAIMEKSAERCYELIRTQVSESKEQPVVLWKDFGVMIADEIRSSESISLPEVEDLGLYYRSALHGLLWRDVVRSTSLRSTSLFPILAAVNLPEIKNISISSELGENIVNQWFQEAESKVETQIEKLLLLDNWSPVSNDCSYSSSVVDLFSALHALTDVFTGIHRNFDEAGLSGFENYYSRFSKLITDFIKGYVDTIVSSSVPSPQQLREKAALRELQNNSHHLIVHALTKKITKAKLISMTNAVKSKLQSKSPTADGQKDPIPTPLLNIPLPEPASTKTLNELIMRLNNCRQAVKQLGLLKASVNSLSGEVPTFAEAEAAIRKACGTIERLIGERTVFEDLSSTFAQLYNPTPSQSNSAAVLLVGSLNTVMASIFADLHENQFNEAVFGPIVTHVFASVLTALVWILGSGAGDRSYADTDFTIFIDDIYVLRDLFASELSGAEVIMIQPIMLSLESMALSSTEVIDDYRSGKLSRHETVIVLHRRNDPVAKQWLKTEKG